MYQSANFRKAQPSQDAPADKYRSQAQQLQELFPSYSNEDLQSVLGEVNGDVELAVNRISEGHVEQWGSVTRKKDKKPLPTSQSQSKDVPGQRERGDFRGGRGGRGARGGPGRGGARGSFARGGHLETNGHRPRSSQGGFTAPKQAEENHFADVPVNGSAKPSEDAAQEWGTTGTEAVWGEAPQSDATSTTAAWGSSTPSTWGGDTTVNGSTAASPVITTHAPVPTKAVKTPATSKMSWAQIARPQEKPTPPPPTASAPAPPPVSAPPPPAPVRTPSPPQEESTPSHSGWEEPTTAAPPPWDDEPSVKPADAWLAEPEPPAAEELKVAEVTVQLPEEPVAIPERIHPAAPQPPLEPEPVAPVKPLTPAGHTRPGAARSSAKFKIGDQPVVMPSSSFGTAVEKVGMQFGSLSLAGDDLDVNGHDTSTPEPATPLRPTEPISPEVVPPQLPQPQTTQVQELPPPVVSSPAQSSLSAVPSLFQQAIPQQAQQQPPPAQPQSQHTLPTPASLTQSVIPTQTSLHPSSSTTASISPYSTQSQALPQQAVSNHQLPQNQVPIQSQHHQYVQHGLPTHLDSTQSQAQHSPSVPQASQQQNISNQPYFRQPESPYFHAPTPPAGQAQDSPYGTFGQLAQQVQHQGQASHLGGGFGGSEYGYGDNQRQNFYDSYSGQGNFGNRNVLSHDDLKGLPGAQQQQQQHAAPGLPPPNTQPSQQLPPSSQSGSQAQPTAGQGPQQNYPPPVPYYYPYPQNQYYGSPYSSGYNLPPQPYVKYPAVFQGPGGPQSAPSPAAKQGPSAVQSQSPYGQSLYGQQHPSSAYDELSYQHHTQHSHGQSVGSGLPATDYGKHQSLYGAGAQGMQGFMGLGQSSGPAGGPPLGQRAGGASPEAPYKPYGGNVGVKDVGAGVGVGQGGVGQGPQTRGGVQQPTQGSFYAAQRFAAGGGSVPQSQQAQQHQPQAQGPQGHLGYPQGGSDGSTFYSYQPRQQGYWQ